MIKTEQKSSIEERLKHIEKNKYWIIAGILAAVFTYLSLSLAGMIYGQEYVIQRGDLLETHMAYIKMLCRHILNGESIWYSFDISMGMNTSLALAYYAFSPFNIIFLLFYKIDNNVAITIVIILKIALSASAFQLFSKRVLKVDNVCSIIFSICYSLCGFVVANGLYHIMWLDGVIALPLICLFITVAIEENHFLPLSICYAYLFISQFYIGYMVGFFSLVFFVLSLFAARKDIKHSLKDVLKYLLSVLEAILISAIVWVPALVFLLNNHAPDSTTFDESTGVTIIEVINSLFWGQFTDNIAIHSYTYCGLPVLLMIPFYFSNKRISVRERILSGIIVLVLGIGYLFPPMYRFLHAFDAPDFFSFRFAFLLSFVLCAISTRQSIYWKDLNLKNLVFYIFGLSIVYAIEQRFEVVEGMPNAAHDTNNFLINFGLFIGWWILIYLCKRFERYLVAFSLLIICFLFIEEASNLNTYISGRITDEEYYSWENAVSAGIEEIKEKEGGDFYRIIVDDDYSHNSDSLFGYNGICDFGSADNYTLRRAMSNLGYGTSPRVMCASGYNPASNMILGIKYLIFPENEDTSSSGNNTMTNIYLNNETLNLGYMVEDEIKDYRFPSRNVFVNINDILSKMSGEQAECFTEINEDEYVYNFDSSVSNVGKDDTINRYYLQLDNTEATIGIEVENKEYDGVYIQFQNALTAMDTRDYRGHGFNIVNQMDSFLNLGESIGMVYSTESDVYYAIILMGGADTPRVYYDDINIYAFSKEKLSEIYEALSKEQLIIDQYKAGYVKGHITVRSDKRVLFTSIPYDRCWSVWANGEEIIPFATVDNAFLAFELPSEGDYEILMKYKNPNVKLGAIVSLSGLGLLILSVLFGFCYKKNKRIHSSDSTSKKDERFICEED